MFPSAFALVIFASTYIATVYTSSLPPLQHSSYGERAASSQTSVQAVAFTASYSVPASTSASVAGNKLYTIASGDTFYSLAAEYNIPLASLTAANPTLIATALWVGAVITIPEKRSPSQTSPVILTSSTSPVQNSARTFTASSLNPSQSSPYGASAASSQANIPRQASCLIAALATQPCPGTYTVAPGDTFYTIATCCGMDFHALEALNTYTESGLPVGAIVTISSRPVATQASAQANGSPTLPVPGPSHPLAGTSLYTVSAGDNLYAIAASNNIPLATLTAVLNPNINAIITPGQVVTVRANSIATEIVTAPATSVQTSRPVFPQRRQTPANNGVYIVSAGDNLFAIAALYSIPLSSLEALNPTITNQALITAGQPINVPPTSPAAAGPSPTGAGPVASPEASVQSPPVVPQSTYTVMSGDNFYGIAAAKTIPFSSLMVANPAITNPASITVGQPIIIPSNGPDAVTPSQTSSIIVVRETTLVLNNSTGALSTRSSAANNVQYTIYAGEDLYQVTSEYSIPLASLTAVTSSPIPSASSSTPTCDPPIYTILSGDTLYTIAEACGVSLDALAAANSGVVASASVVDSTLKTHTSSGNGRASIASVAGMSFVPVISSHIAGSSPVPTPSPISSNSQAVSAPAETGNPYPNTVTPPPGHSTANFYTTGDIGLGRKRHEDTIVTETNSHTITSYILPRDASISSHSSIPSAGLPCTDNTSLNCIVIGPGTTYTQFPTSIANSPLSAIPCGPDQGESCIVYNSQALTFGTTLNTLATRISSSSPGETGVMSSLSSSSSSEIAGTTNSFSSISASSSLGSSSPASTINSATISNNITSSPSATTLITKTSSTTSQIATTSKPSSAENLKIPLWLLLLCFASVTIATSSGNRTTSSPPVSSKSSSANQPTTLITSTKSPVASPQPNSTSTNYAWMWSILYEHAHVTPATSKSQSPTPRSASTTLQPTSPQPNSTTRATITGRSVHKLESSIVTSQPSSTLCPDNTYFYCYTLGTRTVSSLTSFFNITHSYPLPTATPCPEHSSMACIGMGHETFSFWYFNITTSLDSAVTSTPEVSKTQVSTASLATLQTSTIKDTSALPLTTKTSVASGSLKLPMWILILRSIGSVFGYSKRNLKKRQPPLEFSTLSRLPTVSPCPDNTPWQCVDFTTSTFSFNPATATQSPLATTFTGDSSGKNSSTSEVAKPSNVLETSITVETSATVTTIQASMNKSPSALPSTTKTSAASRSLKLPMWMLLLRSVSGVFASLELSLTPVPSVLEQSSTLRPPSIEPKSISPSLLMSGSAFIKSLLPSWPLLLVLASFVLALKGASNVVSEHKVPLDATPVSYSRMFESAATGSFFVPIWLLPRSLLGTMFTVPSSTTGTNALFTRSFILTPTILFIIILIFVKPTLALKPSFPPSAVKEVITKTRLSFVTAPPVTIDTIVTETSLTGVYSYEAPTPTQAGPAIKPTIGSHTYYGCQTEAMNARALNASVHYNYTAMTLEMCASMCPNCLYFGVEYGGECWCGDLFNAGSVKAPDTDCSSPCPGNHLEYCGAGNRLSVYIKNNMVVPSGFAPVGTSSGRETATVPGSVVSANVSHVGASALTTSMVSNSSGNVTSASADASADGQGGSGRVKGSVGTKLDRSFLLVGLGLGLCALAPFVLGYGESQVDTRLTQKEEKVQMNLIKGAKEKRKGKQEPDNEESDSSKESISSEEEAYVRFDDNKRKVYEKDKQPQKRLERMKDGWEFV